MNANVENNKMKRRKDVRRVSDYSERIKYKAILLIEFNIHNIYELLNFHPAETFWMFDVWRCFYLLTKTQTIHNNPPSVDDLVYSIICFLNEMNFVGYLNLYYCSVAAVWQNRILCERKIFSQLHKADSTRS